MNPLPSTRLFVSNIPGNFDENALRETFSSYGEIVNFDLKNKIGVENDKKTFAFVTISASNFNIESCIRHFANEDFNGHRLYVTRARESFLERLQREREQSKQKAQDKQEDISLKKNISHTESLGKRKFNQDSEVQKNNFNKRVKVENHDNSTDKKLHMFDNELNHKIKEMKQENKLFHNDQKKKDSDKKRLESMKRKRQEFNEKKNIIKTGLISIDKQQNKKIIFSNDEDNNLVEENLKTNGHFNNQINHKKNLFDDRINDQISDDELNFEIKDQYEGKKGQKVLDLQSRYKSDKRFVIDKRFIEDSASEKEDEDNKEVDLNQVDEKSKQLDILQNILGVPIKTKVLDTGDKAKPKLAMLRFDPLQPEHSKYLAPTPAVQEPTKKTKKKKSKETKDECSEKEPEIAVEKVEVSKEQFYKISDTLKDAIAQPVTFSLRSLFTQEDKTLQEDEIEENKNYIPLHTKKDAKVKNPLDPGEKNPFVYDSSDSDNEDGTDKNKQQDILQKNDIKTVWREKLFFSTNDNRLKDGLLFFTKGNENQVQKERRELKSLMKKRIYNQERKNTMFQKKIGGRKKSMKKKYRK